MGKQNSELGVNIVGLTVELTCGIYGRGEGIGFLGIIKGLESGSYLVVHTCFLRLCYTYTIFISFLI